MALPDLNVVVRAIERVECLNEQPDWAVRQAFREYDVPLTHENLAEVMLRMLRYFRGLLEKKPPVANTPKARAYALRLELLRLNYRRKLIEEELARLAAAGTPPAR